MKSKLTKHFQYEKKFTLILKKLSYEKSLFKYKLLIKFPILKFSQQAIWCSVQSVHNLRNPLIMDLWAPLFALLISSANKKRYTTTQSQDDCRAKRTRKNLVFPPTKRPVGKDASRLCWTTFVMLSGGSFHFDSAVSFLFVDEYYLVMSRRFCYWPRWHFCLLASTCSCVRFEDRWFEPPA